MINLNIVIFEVNHTDNEEVFRQRWYKIEN